LYAVAQNVANLLDAAAAGRRDFHHAGQIQIDFAGEPQSIVDAMLGLHTLRSYQPFRQERVHLGHADFVATFITVENWCVVLAFDLAELLHSDARAERLALVIVPGMGVGRRGVFGVLRFLAFMRVFLCGSRRRARMCLGRQADQGSGEAEEDDQ